MAKGLVCGMDVDEANYIEAGKEDLSLSTYGNSLNIKVTLGERPGASHNREDNDALTLSGRNKHA
jgi:hypothetical protein